MAGFLVILFTLFGVNHLLSGLQLYSRAVFLRQKNLLVLFIERNISYIGSWETAPDYF